MRLTVWRVWKDCLGTVWKDGLGIDGDPMESYNGWILELPIAYVGSVIGRPSYVCHTHQLVEVKAGASHSDFEFQLGASVILKWMEIITVLGSIEENSYTCSTAQSPSHLKVSSSSK